MKDLKFTACQLVYLVYIYESRCLKVYQVVTYSKVKRINRGYVTHDTLKLTLGIMTIVI